MTEVAESGKWRVARGPGQDDEDKWLAFTPTGRRIVGCAQSRIVATRWSIQPETEVLVAIGASHA